MDLKPEGIDSMRIQTDAARALLAWKSFLDDEIVHRAGVLARANNGSDTITLEHFRTAAIPALVALLTTIQTDGIGDGDKRAA